MTKVNVSFDIEVSKLADLEALLNGKKSGKSSTKSDDDTDFETASDDDDLGFETEDEPDSKVTKKMIMDGIKDRMSAGKKAILQKLHATYKIKNVSGLKEDKYEAFY